MAARMDWLDYAHKLDKEREAIADKLPPGVEVWLSLSSYGFGSVLFGCHLRHAESKCNGYGTGRTPAKALEAAKVELREKREEQLRRPRLEGELLAIAAPVTPPSATLF